MNELGALRERINLRRQQLSADALRDAEASLLDSAALLSDLSQARTILSFLPMQGELSPVALNKQLGHARHFLPRIIDFKTSQMAFYSAQNPREENHYGIVEPKATGEPIAATELDLVLAPLVAFDRNGNRVGMGGGYYDRAFAFRRDTKNHRKPLLVGVAHYFQEVENLSPAQWDVPLDAILTDRECIDFRPDKGLE